MTPKGFSDTPWFNFFDPLSGVSLALTVKRSFRNQLRRLL
jgi:hypothetical protein